MVSELRENIRECEQITRDKLNGMTVNVYLMMDDM